MTGTASGNGHHTTEPAMAFDTMRLDTRALARILADGRREVPGLTTFIQQRAAELPADEKRLAYEWLMNPANAPEGDAPNPDGRRAILSGGDLMRLASQPVTWAVAGLFESTDLAIIYGDAGTKKTWLAIDLAIHVAAGRPWLNRAVMPGPVLFVDEESGPRVLARRYERICRTIGVDGSSLPVGFLSMGGLNLAEPEGKQFLDLVIDELKPVLIVLDAFSSLASGIDENSVKDTAPVLRYIRGLAEERLVLLVHHAGKAGGYRGSSHLKATASVFLQLQAVGETSLKLSSEKVRSAEPFALSLQTDFSDDGFSLTETAAETLTASERAILQALARGQASTKTLEVMTQLGYETTRKAVRALAAKGRVQRTNPDAPSREQAIWELLE